MKTGNTTNQGVTRDFLKATMRIIAQNTSSNYSKLAIMGVKAQLNNEFEFSKNIHIKDGMVKVDKSINSISRDELRKFFIKVIDIVGPKYLKLLLVKKLKPKELNYLENLGLDIW